MSVFFYKLGGCGFESRWSHWYILWVIERSWFMQESQSCKPDCLDDSKSLSLKKTCTVCWIKVFQISYCRLEAKRQVCSFWCTVYHFFCGLEPHCFFSIPEWLRYDLEITRGVHIKKDCIVSTFEYWSYHDRELYWSQDYLLPLLWCHLIFGK